MSAKIGAEELEPPESAPNSAGQGDDDEVDRMAEKYGPPRDFDPDFHGPIDKRGCTDVLCLLLLIAFIIGWSVVAVIAWKKGDPAKLVHPTDSFGKQCPSKLVFFDITKCADPSVLLKGCRTPQVCVDSCPNETISFEIGTLREEQKKEKMICLDNVNKDKYSVRELLDKGLCTKYLLPSRSIAGRCIPNLLNDENLKTLGNTVNQTKIIKGTNTILEFLNARENIEFIFEDLRSSWLIIIFLLLVGAVMSLTWICLMRCFAGFMVWLSLFGTIGVLGYGFYFSLTKYLELRKETDEDTIVLRRQAAMNNPEKFVGIIYDTDIDKYLKLKNTWLGFAIASGTLLAILLFVVLVLRSRLAIAVALIRQGARAVSDMTFTLAWPLVPWVFQVLVIGFFLSVGIYIISASEELYRIAETCECGEETLQAGARCYLEKFRKQCPNTTECGLKSACNFVRYQKLSWAGYLHLYNFFGLLWLLCFIEDFGDMVLAGSFAGWYWTFNRKTDLATFPVAQSASRITRFHLGTIAFGSLIISIIKFIRFLLEYVDYKLRQYNENPIAKAILCCFKCCFWCLEKFMKFINRNAYIMCAVYGKNFCTSARDAFFLLMRNAVRAFVLDKVTDFLLFMGKIVIVGGVSILSFFILSEEYSIFKEFLEVRPLHFYFIPIILIALGTYFIASLFFSVYSMAVDTLFLCFLEDCERNDGSEEKPYYMPKELMEILGKKNKTVSSASSK